MIIIIDVQEASQWTNLTYEHAAVACVDIQVDDYTPKSRVFYLLQNHPKKSDLNKLVTRCPDVAIIVDDLENCFIGRTCCGANIYKQIEEAYIIIDGVVPTSPHQ